MPPIFTLGEEFQAHNSKIDGVTSKYDKFTMSEDITYRDVGERLEALRKLMGGNHKGQWAQLHGFNATQYHNWEKGVRRINVDAALRLCERYGLTLDWVYRGRADGLPDSLRNSL